jgi:hypothetical protein
MRTGRPRAKPRVNQCRAVSIEADALSRQLQAQLNVSANELAERAIYALAEVVRTQTDQPVTAQ